MQVNTRIITNLFIKNNENKSFLAKYTRPSLTKVSELKLVRAHPLLKVTDSDTFAKNAFVEVNKPKKIQIIEQANKDFSIKFVEESTEHNSEIELNQKVLQYCKAEDSKTNLKLFKSVKQIFNNKKLDERYNFYELLRNCQGTDKKLDLTKLELVNHILNNRKLTNNDNINTVLATCVVDGSFNINLLRCARKLLDFKRIKDSTDFFFIIAKTKNETKKIDKKLFDLSEKLLNHPNVFNMQDTEDLLNISKNEKNKLDTKLSNLIMKMLSSKKLAYKNSDEVHNSTACLKLFDACKNKRYKIDKDLLKVLENLFNSDKITNMRRTLKTMKIIQKIYLETSNKNYLKEVNKLIKNKNIQSQQTLLLNIELLSNEKITDKRCYLERHQLKNAIEAKSNFVKSDFSRYLNGQKN